MTDCPAREQLALLLSEQLRGPDAERVEAHVQTCDRCQQALEDLSGGGLTDPGTPDPCSEPRPEFLRRLREQGPDADATPRRADGAADTAGLPGRAAGAAAEVRPAVPGYEVLGELGRGGMGVVYQARQLRLGRVVALKVLLAGAHAGQAERARFKAEAEAVARLQHPNIVQVYEVGEEGGCPYLALEYVEGRSLSDRVRGTPLPTREAAQLAEDLTRAVHAAHERGVVHRDLKPANVLLAADGTPKITDFGLAKRLDGVTLHTQTGAVLGTPEFMSPEQAEGKAVGPATDVYSLGALLYHMLTGRPPFVAENALDTLLRVRLDEPVSPSVLQPRTPRDLGTVCLKCLQKDPGKRYASAAALADDLRRFRHGEPIQARPVSSWERAGKWVKRRPALAALASAIVLVGLALVASLAALWLNAEARARAVRQLDQAQRLLTDRQGRLNQLEDDIQRQQQVAERTRAEVERLQAALPGEQAKAREARLTTRRALYVRDMHLAQTALDRGQVTRLLTLLEKHRPPPGEEDVRGFEWHLLWRLCHGERAVLGGHPGCFVRDVRFSPDGKTLASAAAWAGPFRRAQTSGTGAWAGPFRRARTSGTGEEGLKLWDAVTGAELLLPRKEVERVVSVAYAPDGRTLAAGRSDGLVELWDVAARRTRTSFRAHAGSVLGLAIAPDGRTLVTGGEDGRVKLWDLLTPRERATWAGHGGAVWRAEFSPDGKTLATAGADNTVRLWDVATGGPRCALLRRAPALAGNVAFSPDGQTLAVSEFSDPFYTGHVRFWDTATGKEQLPAIAVPGGAWGLSFTPDGRHLAVSDNGGIVRLWDVATRRLQRTFLGHTQRLHALAFSPDGKTMATGGNDGTLRLWDVAAPAELPVTLREPAGAGASVWTSVTLAPDGNTLAVWYPHGDVWLLDRKTGRRRTFRSPHGNDLAALAFAPDAQTLATAGNDGVVRLWDAGTLTERAALRGHAARIEALAFAPDGKTLASGGRDGRIRLWDPGTGKEQGTLPANTLPSTGIRLAFSPDGRALASGGTDGTVLLWDPATRRPVAMMTVPGGGVMSLAFSPDGSRLAAANYGGTVMLWDLAVGTRRLPAVSAGAVAFAAASPVALALPALALAPRGGDQDLLASLAYPGRAFQVAFTPDGQTLMAAYSEHGVVFWDVATLQERFVLRGPSEGTVSLALSPDGQLLATGIKGGGVYLWDVRADPEPRWVFLRPPEADLRGHRGAVSSVAFDPRHGRLASGSLDRTVKVWDTGAWKLLRDFTGHTRAVWGVAWSPDGERLASAGGDSVQRNLPGEVVLWDAATGKKLVTLPSPGGGVHAVAFRPDGKRLAAVGFDRTVHIWDTSSGKEIRAIPGHTGELWGVAYSPDGKLLASAGFDHTVRLWDADTGRAIRTLAGHSDVVWGLAFSPDGKRLASASDDHSVRVWDVATGNVVHVLRGHTISPYGVAFSPDDKRLASASGHRWQPGHAGEVLVWDAATGTKLATLDSATSGFFGVAFSPDGKHLSSAGMDGSVKVWDAALAGD